ncbi:MAG: WYL domain-containing protein [Rhodocyclales bacterium]|nr:WYL domain-containing protein [Rhodocyclales bacterium]
MLLEILKRIPKNEKVSTSDLRQQLKDVGIEREMRTLQRQLDMLSQNFEIERDDTNAPYGYRWKEKASGFSAPVLTEQESLLLALAEEHLRYQLPASLMKSMSGFFEQARGRLNRPGSAQRAKEWLGKVRVVSITQPLLPPKLKESVFEAVSQALYENHWLEVEYRNAQGKRNTARVMPLGLAQQGPRLYLVCRFHGFNNERSLAMHRILSAEVSTLTFQRPAGFKLEQYDDDGRFGFGEGKRIYLTFRINKMAGQHLLETPLSRDQQVKDLGDVYEVSATVVESEQLKWWLRGFGSVVTVFSPASLLDLEQP